MPLTVGVPRETASGERRVAIAPDVAKKLVSSGYQVLVEKGAGEAAYFYDGAFEEAGARLVDTDEALSADVVFKVAPPNETEARKMKKGGIYIGFLSPLDDPQVSQALAAQGVTALSMELVPRISRAQKMDALSAMSSIAGYKAVLAAATALPKFFPLLTTAADTIRPANVLVLGAGVAGLQAIATARRLGARVSAYDIRDAVKEEVESLGAKFVELEFETQKADDSGGYAKELAQEKAEQQTKLLVPHIGRSDVVITTALIPGRPAPVLVTADAVAAMAPGSIIVDLAAPNGGNCVHTEPGKEVTVGGVTIQGPLNLPSEAAVNASEMYGRTVTALLSEFADGDSFTPDFEDEIFQGACVTHAGDIVNERVKGLLA